jgi:uncharacterized membrane protein YcjF (UPF0283 family)
VDWTIYGALILGFLAIAAGSARLFVHTRQMWRLFRQLRRNLARELERLAEVSEATSAAAERAGDQERLNESLARLRVSLAQFAVLRAAFDEATDAFGRIAAVVPRK